uniref:F-box domain-containing protein n=2 Tax=Oryza brachyantha TaxID=4533 RepID=J3MR35_ORYBR
MDAVTVSPAPATPPVPAREWSELPLDALCVVFAKLGAVELLRGTGSLVCRSWQKATMAPDVWRTVDMMTHHQMLRWTKASGLCAMAKVAVDRADGQLEVFMGSKFVTNQLLTYICDR